MAIIHFLLPALVLNALTAFTLPEHWQLFWVELSMPLGWFLALGWLVRRRGWVPVLHALGLLPLQPWGWLQQGLVLSVLLLLATLLLGMLAQFVPISTVDPWLALPREQRWVVALLAVFSAPLLEELIFRGFLQPLLFRSLGLWGALAGTPLLFMLVHVNYQWGSLPQLTVLSLGILLSWARHRTQSIAPGVLAHAFNNACGAWFLLQAP
ncbi:MAG: CPBP family intramembrane glutamic endopeptidase [Candidatus Melainabacteria bacterium]|nr:CPBP family intramembrane glutamic endopeptidase [Candidatus Melainabacteria bacterium]